jgi:hypothetical protein
MTCLPNETSNVFLSQVQPGAIYGILGTNTHHPSRNVGDIVFYRDRANDGTRNWAYGGEDKLLGGSGWGVFRTAFANGDGAIYAVHDNGNLYYMKHHSRGGELRHLMGYWAYEGGARIVGGPAWTSYAHVFGGGHGYIYAVKPTGELVYYRDLARDGTSVNGMTRWANGGNEQLLATGWNAYTKVFADHAGVIYGIGQDGALYWHKHQNRGQAGETVSPVLQHPIGGTGWGQFRHAFSGNNGVLYAVTQDGDVYWYRDLANDGTLGPNWSSWAYNGAGQKIYDGPKWKDYRLMFAESGGIEGYTDRMSVAAGEATPLALHVSTYAPTYKAAFYRLKKADVDPADQEATGLVVTAGGTLRTLPECGASSRGPGWPADLQVPVPANWRSGLYAAYLEDAHGFTFYAPFVVRPGAGQPLKEIAVIANTNTWNSYNDWGGNSRYSNSGTRNDAPVRLSFRRPNPNASPRGGPGEVLASGLPSYAYHPNHLVRAELWVLEWLESLRTSSDPNAARYAYDMYDDYDMHQGIRGISLDLATTKYKALILTVHPEYWSLAARANLLTYLQNGGVVIYLGGNAIYEVVTYESTDPSTMRVVGPDGVRDLFRDARTLDPAHPALPERALLGVAYEAVDSITYAPYIVSNEAHEFTATLAPGQAIGATGRQNAASGWEMDWRGPGTPAGTVLLAKGANPDTAIPRDANGNRLYTGGAEMLYYAHPGGGWVFSAGSMTFGGSLVDDANLQTIVRRAIRKALNLPLA